MISNPRLLFYTCIAKEKVILAEFSSSSNEDPEIEAIALRCIENVPLHHSMVSHTVHKRTYSLIIDGLFSYFAILDEAVTKSESVLLFNRLKSAMDALIEDGSVTDSLDNPIHRCLQSKLDPVFAEISHGGGDRNKDLELDLGFVESPRSIAMEIKNRSLNSPRGRRGGGGFMPLLGKPSRVLKNKKRLQAMDIGGGGGGCVLSKGIRNGLIHDHQHKQKVIWRKHVWVVLMFDVCICVVLFGIWLWVCQGLQCIDG